MDRRNVLALAAATAVCGVPQAHAADNPSAARPFEIRIGYQKSSLLAIAKQQKLIETRFGSGVAVRWVEFAYGPPLLEALGVGRLDYGYTGNAPPVFAQSAHAPILYVAALTARGENVGIAVPPTSGLKGLGDLKGKTVGVAKGSSAHDLLVAAVESVGLAYSDIKPVYLAPADAASAFATGSIDAWSIWDPFLAIAEISRKARRLEIDPAVARQNAFLLANRDFTVKYPHVVAALNEDVATAARYTRAHHDEAAALFSAATGVPLAAESLAVSRNDFDVVPMSDAIVRKQQAVADRFARTRMIPASIAVADVIWPWTPGG